jgi:hypothetical protein
MSRKSNLRPIVVRPIPGYLDEHQPRSTKLPQLKIILEHGRDIHALLTARFDESCPRDDEALDGIGKAVQGVQYGLMIWTLAEWGVDKAKAAADPANTWSRVQVALGGLSEAYVAANNWLRQQAGSRRKLQSPIPPKITGTLKKQLDLLDRLLKSEKAIARVLRLATRKQSPTASHKTELRELGNGAEKKGAPSTVRTSRASTAPRRRARRKKLATVWYHGDRSYSTDGHAPVIVPAEQHNALKAFLDSEVARSTKHLENAGVSNVTKVMKILAKKFPGSGRGPKDKGDGYYIRVRTKDSHEVATR